ncbi:hypothetical protein WA026_008108 [Henosepilachna vigintioctopunctata]|uniref:Uncharacterized protein n=1 Tax=Henosepilachna vigintioctopunctata TaxID=420089 RepID=A0AAW1TQY4_9CUCU
MKVQGSISYSPQNPWLFPSSIKQNILFGQPYDAIKYKAILEACALAFDLDVLAIGDETILNDCGINLSKGQQARINIARALYKESDIYIFDDSLSSLDNHVKTYVFQNCIQNYLKDKLIILSTHDNRFVKYADNVTIMCNGTVKYSGKPIDMPPKLTETLENLNKNSSESDEITNENPDEIDEDLPPYEDTKLIEKTCSSAKANIYHETLQTGAIRWSDYKKYFMFGGGFMIFNVIIVLSILIEALSGLYEKLLSKWVSMEEKMNLNSTSESFLNMSLDTFTVLPVASGNFSLNYPLQTTPMESFNISEENFANLDTYGRNFYIHTYSTLIMSVCILVFISHVIFFTFSLKISKNLHKSMISKVLGATMSFFDVNMSGNILNRFSKDLYAIDEWIPFIIYDVVNMMSMLAATCVLIATINKFFSAMTIILVLIFALACWYFIRPARALRRISSATRSPLVGHLNATLQGLITIRAYGTQRILINEYDKHQDHVLASSHLFEISIRCLAFSLHMLSASYIAVIILRFLIDDVESSSNVGLAITQSFVLSNFLDWGLRQWVMLESIMTSFQRSAEYTDIKQETQAGQSKQNWPSQGCIEFKNVSLTYEKYSETVLRNLTFTIKPREKIGVVGRTGAGKSSLIVSLFRLYETEGDILIDDVNIKTLPLRSLRNQVALIPQDPVLFTGSVRSNIDPLEKYSDSDIWLALSAVNLNSAIKNLDEDINESGLTHSIGQRQLFCLARAIVRNTKIIILDEATANMDEETDRFIHKKIKEISEQCTTITVAHRLHTVMECDRVMVMDNGKIVEFGAPHVLLQNNNSLFYKMVHHQDSS